MPRREDPKIQVRIGQVIAYYPGASSLQVEEQVTKNWSNIFFNTRKSEKRKRHPQRVTALSSLMCG